MSRSSQKRPHAVSMWLILIVVNTCLLGCASREQRRTVEPPRPSGIQKLLVVPFKAAAERYEIGATVRCSTCGTVFVTGPMAQGGAGYMTEQLMTFLRDETAYTLIPPRAGEGVRSKILSESLGMPDRDLLIEMGRKLKADAIVSGTVFRFRQRVGTGYSVETPASVAFGIHLIRVGDGHLMWGGHADETQQPLSENLFKFFSFVKGGAAWLTAEELGSRELNEMMKTFPLP